MKDPLIEGNSGRNRTSTTLVTTNRVINIPVQLPNSFVANKISTSKYNCLTFMPKNLWEQFHKLANIYFLILAVLQIIPQTSNSNGIPNIMLPLSMVLVISGVKDLVEDNKRKKSDNEENNRKILKRVNKNWVEEKWQNLRIGDIVKVEKDNYFPADIVLLASSDPKGMCYVETKNLDGETNLKHKLAEKFTQSMLKNENNLDSLQCEIKCDDPNPMIYSFNGLLKIHHTFIALTHEQLLLRGSSLKNTEWIIGIPVYTGHETKIMLNSPRSRVKFSNLEINMNRQIIFIFIVQILICSFCAAFYTIWLSQTKSDTDYYLKLKDDITNPAYVFVIMLFSWMLLFSSFIPISLLVTLEIVKFLQAILIANDLELYYEPIDMAAGVQSSNLNEDLGQISYIFSDKTGTLTCNIMEFKKISIGGESYGNEEHVDPSKKIPHVDFVDSRFNPKSESAREFLLQLALCHTIITEEKNGVIEYKASSPDELALVNAAKYFGVEYIGRDEDHNILVKVDGRTNTFQLLNLIEFNSDRKRMTVIVKMPNGNIKLLLKGADTVVWPRVITEAHRERTLENLENYANQGLRTLLLAAKDLKQSEYDQWNEKYLEAIQDLRNKEKRIEELAEEIETNLRLVGATAIEDKLQDNVPETIQFLREAGLKIWVLTGDKVETAINIGYSCNLLANEMLRVTVIGNKTDIVKEEIRDGLLSMREAPERTFALIISGEALIRALKPEMKQDLLRLAEHCNAVLACRVSPQQKADIVKLIRDAKPKVRTLSIGDGANDVNMINAAHVGIGIAGLEGKQAVRASDYSVAQFSYLKKLMCVHGRECYRRNSNLICYNFYKNIMISMPLFFFGTLSAFSAQAFFNTWVFQFYNLFFAAIPIGFYAVFDKEMDHSELLSECKYYSLGLNGTLFKTWKFWMWIGEATIQGCLILYCSVFSLGVVPGLSSGRVSGISICSMMVFGSVVILVNVKVFVLSNTHYWFTIMTMILSAMSYLLILAFFFEILPPMQQLQNFDGYGGMSQLLGNPNTYILIVFLIYTCFYIEPLVLAAFELKHMKKEKIEIFREHELHKSDISTPLPTSELEAEEKAIARRSIAIYGRRHTGFAFSGEPGHDLPITDPQFYEKQEILVEDDDDGK